MKSVILDLVRVTEDAAIAASDYIGSGDKLGADRVATEAMRERLNKMFFYGDVQIGEGKKDKSYGLFKGERVGYPVQHPSECEGMQYEKFDIAVDPIDGTRPTVNSGPEAIATIAISNPGCMFDTEEPYMVKLACGPVLAPHLSLRYSLDENIRLAKSILKRKLTVCILDRPRHIDAINRLRQLGCSLKLIRDCDVSGAIATCRYNSGVDILYGAGGSPEAVLSAAALKGLGGKIECELWPLPDFSIGVHTLEIDKVGKSDIIEMEQLVKGPCAFAATGITDGSMLKGVRKSQKSIMTHSFSVRSESGTERWIKTKHGN
jgi:fructose-1,6-bisphosphatase class II